MPRFLGPPGVSVSSRWHSAWPLAGARAPATLLNRVIEAEKEAAANVILRREETAATRSLANTARVMAEHPVLLRLKELEAMKEIAERIEEVRVVIGADGFGALLPAGYLARGEKVGSG